MLILLNKEKAFSHSNSFEAKENSLLFPSNYALALCEWYMLFEKIREMIASRLIAHDVCVLQGMAYFLGKKKVWFSGCEEFYGQV